MDLVTRALAVSSIDEAERSVEVIASTNALDSHGEIVEQDWILDRYLSNPVVLWNHNKVGQPDTRPIGRGEHTRVEDGKLKTKIFFASKEANSNAESIWLLFKEKVLRAVSVGFNPRDVSLEKRDGNDTLILRQNELYEISCTPVPSNPETLASLRARALENVPPADERGGETQTAKELNVDELQKVEAALEETTKSLDDASKLLDSERAKAETLNERCKALETSLGDATEQVEKLTSELVSRDLDALVGKKIAVGEKDSLIKLAAKDPELYREHLDAVKARPDMKLVDEGSVMGSDPAPTKAEDLNSRVQKRIR